MDVAVAGPHGPQPTYVYTGGRPFDRDLPTLVFIHGAMHDHSVWTLLARWFAHHGRTVLAPDLPGHARSAGPQLHSVEALASWLIGLLDATGVEHATLAGHSMGALIALEAAALAPQRVERLLLLGAAYPMTVSPALLETARAAPLRAIDLVNSYSHSSHAAKPAYPGPGSWIHGGNRALMRRVQLGGAEGNLFLTDFEVCNAYAGGLAAARRITCPVSLILGERDQMAPPKAAHELGLALRADVTQIAAGHALMAEAPDAVLAAMRHALA